MNRFILICAKTFERLTSECKHSSNVRVSTAVTVSHSPQHRNPAFESRFTALLFGDVFKAKNKRTAERKPGN